MSKNSADVDFGSTRDAQIELRSGPMGEAQHPAKPFGAFDDVRCRFGAAIRLDQPIIDALVIPLPVIVSDVLSSGFSKRPFAEED